MSNPQKILTEQDQISILEPEQTLSLQVKPAIESNNQTVQINIEHQHINHKAENLIGLITHQIQNEIQKSKINISNQTTPFDLNDKNNSQILKHQSQKLDEKKIAEFVKKRKSLEQQIRRLKLEQQQQKHKGRSKSPKQDIHYKTFKSNFTSQQHMQISRIMKQSQEFQHHLQQKDKKIKQMIEIQREKKKKQHQKSLQKLKQIKKQEALKKIKKIQEQQRQRTQKIKAENIKYKQLKRIKLLHEKIEQHDKLFEEQKRQKQMQFLKQKRQSMTFNFEEIKNHERKCYETSKMIKQKIQNDYEQKINKMKQNQKFQSQTYRPSKFLLTLWNEEKQKQEQQKQKIQKMKILFTKKNGFQQKLRDIHKQEIKPKSKPKQDMRKSIIDQKLQQRRLKVKSMSAADIYKQGQQYMKSVHSSIKPTLIQQSKIQLQNNYKSLRDGNRTQYRDYLQQHKIKKQLLYSSTDKLNKKYNPQIHQLQNLIGRKKQNTNQKLYKAKIIVEKLDQKAKKLSTAALVDSISAKLKIIQEFS